MLILPNQTRPGLALTLEVAAADAARHRRRELPGVKDDLVPK